MECGHVWDHLDDVSFTSINALSEMISRNDRRSPGWLTNIRSASGLVLAGDYGGDHQTAVYGVFSLLIADGSMLEDWEDARTRLRQQLLSNREMEYKKLRDRLRRRALVPFLQAASLLRGLLLNVLVRKNLPVFQPDASGPENCIVDAFRLKPATLDRLCTVAHLGGMLISCMSAAGQSVLWLSDEDEIAANPERRKIAQEVLINISNHYLRHDLGSFCFSTLSPEDDDMWSQDMAAVSDLSAGALCDTVGHLSTRGRLDADSIWRPIGSPAKPKAAPIIDWIARGSGSLARAVFVLEVGSSPGKIEVRQLHFGRGL